MKRIIIFVLVFILIFVVGCSFKDDSNTDNSITTDAYNEEILDSVNSESVNIEQSNETDKIPLPIDFSQYTTMNGRTVDDLMDDLYELGYPEPVVIITGKIPNGDSGVFACLTDGDTFKFDDFYFEGENDLYTQIYLYFPQKIQDISACDQTGYDFEENYDDSHTIGNDQFFGRVNQFDMTEEKEYFATVMRTLSVFTFDEIYNGKEGYSRLNHECMLGRQLNITAKGIDGTEYSISVYIENNNGLSAKPDEINLYNNWNDFERDFYYYGGYAEPFIILSNGNEEYKIVYSDELILLNENDYLCYICVPNEDMRVSWDNPEICIGVADKKMRSISGSKESIGTYTITATNDSTGEQYIFNIKK